MINSKTFRETLQESLKFKDIALKQFTLNGSRLNLDAGTNSSGETIVI